MGIASIYYNIHLLPLSEYSPTQELSFPGDSREVPPTKYTRGRKYALFTTPHCPFSALICHEIIFPSFVRQFVKEGAQFLVNISNDSWFGHETGHRQHPSLAVFRAVENRVFVVRAAGTGISAFINPWGGKLKRLQTSTKKPSSQA
jgi:apolipoprotein N-acyltransferase